ncbi:MAG TPA: hypothetical protein VEK08_07875 [Planctomycetota bacterium]|nr:hypothetical protein [Planctomycetota bacterium]
MGIAVRLRCSECATIRDVDLKAEERDITCPVCARRIQNLTAAEHEEVAAVQKKQKLFSLISILFFVFAAVCIVMWVGGTETWISGKAGEPQSQFFIGAMVCALVSIVLGVLGSLKRFVVEF